MNLFNDNRSLVRADEPLVKNSWTPLMLACQANCLEIVEYLVSSLHANVNKSVDYWTALMVACSVERSESEETTKSVLKIVHLLVENKAAINVRNRHGETPLMLAISQGHDEVVEYFLTQDVSLEACDNEGNTALFYAISSGRCEIVKALLKRNVLTRITNRRGDRPRDVALSMGCSEIDALFPEEESLPTVPYSCKSYNSYQELVPYTYPEYAR